jgi:glycosyltransferase involved in cell wall biosynthesis
MRLKISILGTRGIPANYGGFETYAEEISKSLVEIGHDVYVYNPHTRKVKENKVYGINVRYIFDIEPIMPGRILKAVSTIIYDALSLLRASISKTDVIILCGYASGPFMIIPRIFRKKLIVNPDGFEWNSARWGKLAKKWLLFCERLSTIIPNHLISDSDAIKNHFIKKYNYEPTTITYGAPLIKFADRSTLTDTNKDYYLIIARMVPETSIPMMIEGFILSQSEKLLYVVGPIKDQSFFDKEINPLLKKYSNVIFLGPIYTDGDVQKIRYNAFALLHGHASEGTNPSLIESMAVGSIILAIKRQSNIIPLTERYDVFFETVQDLSEKIRWLEHLTSNEISSIKENNFNNAQSRFSWPMKAAEHEKVIMRVLKKE